MTVDAMFNHIRGELSDAALVMSRKYGISESAATVILIEGVKMGINTVQKILGEEYASATRAHG